MNSMICMEKKSAQVNLNNDFFEIYNKDCFKQPPRETWIDGWKIEYMAIADPASRFNTPIVIVGGAFQNFSSYKYCVEQLFEKGPVILIDLPSLGANQQIYNRERGQSAASLELPDLSQMLGAWLDLIGIPKVAMMGMSLGSVVASYFAHQRPELLDRVVLMGVMQETRKSWRMLLEESLLLMQEQRMEEFGQAVILYLVNHAKLDKTRMSPTAKRLFFQQMSAFGQTEQHRYEINCNRLLRLSHVPVPRCKTLVACGQYDSFTLPYENANFALQCPNMQFALIANADHLPQLQRRKETLDLFVRFLKDEPIDQLEGIITLTRAQMQQLEQHSEARVKVQHPQSKLRHRQTTLELPVEIVDLNYFEVLLQFSEVQLAADAAQYPRDLSLFFQDDAGEFKVECLIFAVEQSRLRAIFKHGSFDISARLLAFIQSQTDAALDYS